MQRKFSESNLLCHEVRNFLRAAIFERRRGRLGSKISGHGQLADVAVTSPCPVYLESRHHSERSACPWGSKARLSDRIFKGRLFHQGWTYKTKLYETLRSITING